MVERDDRRPAAPAEALHCPERHLAALARLARAYPELLLERLEHLLRAAQAAADVRADLDHVPADRLEVEHVVEGGDRLAVGRCQVERLADLAQSLGREPAIALLREAQRGQDRRAAVRVERRDGLDLVVESRGLVQRSTSPITVSSEPTIAIMSATRASRMQVAVASRATKLGALNFTRHGLGPPSETT